MCRMIAAAGQFDPRAMRNALALMAANENPAHRHEKRALGAAYRHEDGWGAAWLDDETIHVRHSVHSCLEDPSVEELDDLQTDLMLLHARRASRPGTVSLENTHPFLAEYNGRPWAFCHNGTIHDIRALRPPTGLIPGGTMDSELLFLHILNHLDPSNLETSLAASLDPIQDYTALHCMLVTADRIVATARRHPVKSDPEYHALWEGSGPSLHVISSEPVNGIGCEKWQRVPEPGVLSLERSGVSLRAV